jgi:hypothetical protein
MRWLVFALVLWLTLCNPFWPVLIAVVYLMPPVLFAWLQRLLQDQSAELPTRFDSGLVLLPWEISLLSV